MPLFKSTGVGEKAEFVVGMVSSRPFSKGRLVNGSEDSYTVVSVDAGSTTAWTPGAASWTSGFTTALRTFGAAFRALDFKVAFFAAFAWTGDFLAVGAAVTLRRLGAAVGFVFFARAFFVFRSCQRFFCAAAMRFRAATLNRFLPVIFGSMLAVTVEVDRLESPWPSSAWISAMAASIRFRCISYPTSAISRTLVWSIVVVFGMYFSSLSREPR